MEHNKNNIVHAICEEASFDSIHAILSHFMEACPSDMLRMMQCVNDQNRTPLQVSQFSYRGNLKQVQLFYDTYFANKV